MIEISPLGIKKSNRQTMVNKTLHRNQKTEQHEYQTQGGGGGYCVQIDSQGRCSVYRQTHRGGVVCTDRHRAT